MRPLIELHLDILATSLSTLREPFCSTEDHPRPRSSQENTSISTKAVQLAIATRMKSISIATLSPGREQLSEIRNVVIGIIYHKGV
jgi:hypothetical protein